MTQAYTGMRKGISIVEIMIAIILFAALSVISLKYAKNYFDTDMAAKKARVAAATDQASQLLAAYQIYKTETGAEPASISDLNGSSGILVSIPTTVREMSNTGWKFAGDYNGTGSPAFYMELDSNGTWRTAAQVKGSKEYCAIFNREFNQTGTYSSLAVDDTTTFGVTPGTLDRADFGGENYLCWSKDVNTTVITVFVP